MLTLAERQQRACNVGANVEFKTNDGRTHAGVVTKHFGDTGQVTIFDEDEGRMYTGMSSCIQFIYPAYEPTTPLLDRAYVMVGV